MKTIPALCGSLWLSGVHPPKTGGAPFEAPLAAPWPTKPRPDRLRIDAERCGDVRITTTAAEARPVAGRDRFGELHGNDDAYAEVGTLTARAVKVRVAWRRRFAARRWSNSRASS
jgi:hypothetical protein